MQKTDLKKIVLRALANHKVRTVVTLLTIISSIVLQILPPLVLGRAVDILTDNKAISVGLAAGYFALIACSGLSDAFREAMIVRSGEGITHALRSAMMAKMRRLPAAYFTDHEAGKTTSIQVNDVDAVEDMFSSGIVSMFSDLGTVGSMLIVIFTRSAGLGIILLIVLPLLSMFTAHVQKKMLAAHTENRRATAQASGILPETMHITRSLHVYHAEAFAEKRYDRAVKDSFQALERTNFYDAVYSPVILTVSAAVIGVMMSLSGQSGAFQSWFGMSVGTAVALIAYVNSIFTPLASIGMEIQTVQSAAAGWKRVQEFLNEKERAMPAEEIAEGGCDAGTGKDSGDSDKGKDSGADADQGITGCDAGVESTGPDVKITNRPAGAGEEGGSGEPGIMGRIRDVSGDMIEARDVSGDMIEARDVSFSYDGMHQVLEDFSLHVARGEFVTLTGRTGAGKSTLFKLVLGLYEPSAGEIRIGGMDPVRIPDHVRRKLICCVEQKASPVPGTIRDQVTLGNPDISDDAVWKALETADLKATVETVPGQLDAPYKEGLFSQGQKQLLMIARAIVSDPEILLLDEITAGLDSATEKMIVDALMRVSKGRTVLSISHRMSQVMPGRIVEMRTAASRG